MQHRKMPWWVSIDQGTTKAPPNLGDALGQGFPKAFATRASPSSFTTPPDPSQKKDFHRLLHSREREKKNRIPSLYTPFHMLIADAKTIKKIKNPSKSWHADYETSLACASDHVL